MLEEASAGDSRSAYAPQAHYDKAAKPGQREGASMSHTCHVAAAECARAGPSSVASQWR